MKIAFIAVKGLPMSGGIEKYTDDVATLLSKKGHEVVVYTSKHYGNTTGSFGNYKIIALHSSRIRKLEKITLVFHASLHQLFCKYDILHYHALGPSVFAFFGRLAKKKVVIQSHGIEYKRAKWGKFSKVVLKLFEKLSINQGNELTVVSKNLQKHFQETYCKDTIYIPTAVQIPVIDERAQEFGLEKNSYFLFMARIVKEKGLHYLIDAYNNSSITTNKKLIIAGKIDSNDEYHRELLRKASCNPNIVFVGEVLGETKINLLANAYAFCLPSELEGLSIALLEAMSYKKCCIVSDIAENLEVAQGCSIVFENKNVKSLQQAMEFACQNSQIVCDLGESARNYVIENHQLPFIVDELEKMYMNILKNGK